MTQLHVCATMLCMTQADTSSATLAAMREPYRQGWRADISTFAARLALIRHRMGWNIKQAAVECGVTPATWRTWEFDGITPREHVQVAKQISARTGCDYLWLLLGDDADQAEAAA